MMLTIIMKDGTIYKWSKEECTDYEMRKNWFIVLNNEQWVSAYNTDEMTLFEVSK